ncbi:hypothetical protein K525DRAFT_283547 [Schizophyllum commune Loenen D]|nr:hypothetical protein K525DRAFT_283547 [Schizophyllum commune Loenen D]
MDRRRRDQRADDDDADRVHESSLPPTLQPLMFREPQPPPPRDSASRSTYEPRDDDEPRRDEPYPASAYPAPSQSSYPLRPAESWEAQAQREQEVSRRYLPARPVIDDAREHQVPAYALHSEPHQVAGPSSIPHGSSTQYYSTPPVPAPEDPAYRARPPPPPPPRPPTQDTFEFHYNAPGYDPYRERGLYRDEPPVPSSFRPADPMPPRRHPERVPPAPPMEYLRPYTGESGWERRDSRYESYAPSYPDPPPPMEEYGPSGTYAPHRESPWQPEPARYPMPPPQSAPSSSSSSMQPPYRQYQDVEHQYRPLPPPSEMHHYLPDPYAPYYLPPEQPHRYDEPRYEERRYEERSRPMDPSRHESYTPVPSSSQSVYPSRSRPDEEMEPPPQKRPRSTEPRKTQTRKTEIACDFCRGRKLRCDGVKPVCGNCQSRNNVCTYRSSPRRRGPGKMSKAEKARRKAEATAMERDIARSSSSSSSHTTATSAYAGSILPPSSYTYGYPPSSAYMPPHGGPPLPPGPPGPPPITGPPPMTPAARRSVRTPTRPSYAEEPEEDEETERPDEWRGR